MEYISILWKRRWLIVLLVLCAGFLSGVLSILMKPVYEAKTRICVKDLQSEQLSILAELGGMPKNQIANYVEILKSRTIMQETARSLRLNADPYSQDFEDLQNSLNVLPIQGTDLIEIRVQSTDKSKAVHVANALVDSFIQRNLQGNQQEARNAREFVDDQINKVYLDLAGSEKRLEAYKKSNHILDPAGESAELIKELSDLDKEASETEVALHETNARLEGLKSQLGSEKEYITATQTFNENPLVIEYRQKLADLEVALAAALEKYTDRHPTVIQLKAQIDEIKQEMTKEVARVLSSETVSPNPTHQTIYQQILLMQVERLSGEERKKALQNAIKDKEASYQALPQKEMDLTRLVREKTILENTFITLKNKNQEFRIAERSTRSDIDIIDRAIVPQDPVKPKKTLNVLVAMFIGLFVGSVIALLLEYIDTTIKNVEELERLLDLPIIGQIPEEEHESGKVNLFSRKKKSHHHKHRHQTSSDKGV